MKKVKILALTLAAALVLPQFAACSKKPEKGNDTPDSDASVKSGDKVPDYMNATGLPIAKEKITIKAMGKKDPGGVDWNELEIFKKAEELTNIHFELELAESTTYNEKKNLALVSGDYPDVFLREMSSNDEETYGPQGIFLNLKPLIDSYAPNLKKRMAEKPQIKAGMTAIDGNIYGLPYFFQTSTGNPHLSFVSSKWLERVGVSLPKTTDDLYNMLKAFKEKDANGNGNPNDEIPWSGFRFASFDQLILPAFTGLTGFNAVNGAASTGTTFDVKDGKVIFIPTLPEFKEYLIYMNKLFKEGLIDPEFLTQTSQQHLAKVKSGIVGVYNSSPTNLPPETKDEQLSLVPLTSKTNSKQVVREQPYLYNGRGVITDKCKYPEAVMRWFDIWYGKAEDAVEGLYGNTLFVGLENVHWEYADADKKSYKFKSPITSFQDINKSVSVNMEMPSYLEFMAYPAGNPLMEMKVKGVMENQLPYTRSAFPPTARYTKEEFDKASLIENDINTYVTQMMTKFITGDEPITNFEKYTETLKGMKVEDLTTIKQAVYDRWAKAAK